MNVTNNTINTLQISRRRPFRPMVRVTPTTPLCRRRPLPMALQTAAPPQRTVKTKTKTLRNPLHRMGRTRGPLRRRANLSHDPRHLRRSLREPQQCRRPTFVTTTVGSTTTPMEPTIPKSTATTMTISSPQPREGTLRRQPRFLLRHGGRCHTWIIPGCVAYMRSFHPPSVPRERLPKTVLKPG
jgi:hypothetical protein